MNEVWLNLLLSLRHCEGFDAKGLNVYFEVPLETVVKGTTCKDYVFKNANLIVFLYPDSNEIELDLKHNLSVVGNLYPCAMNKDIVTTVNCDFKSYCKLLIKLVLLANKVWHPKAIQRDYYVQPKPTSETLVGTLEWTPDMDDDDEEPLPKGIIQDMPTEPKLTSLVSTVYLHNKYDTALTCMPINVESLPRKGDFLSLELENCGLKLLVLDVTHVVSLSEPTGVGKVLWVNLILDTDMDREQFEHLTGISPVC